MDVSALATAFISGQAAKLQLAAAARMMRMNAVAASSIVQVIEAAQDNMRTLGNVAAGIGGNLDISV